MNSTSDKKKKPVTSEVTITWRGEDGKLTISISGPKKRDASVMSFPKELGYYHKKQKAS
jgi:hypothetical protein